jgi:hypothetical protein
VVGVCTLIREEPAKRNSNALAGQVCAHESRNAQHILDGTESGQAAPDVPVHLRRPGGLNSTFTVTVVGYTVPKAAALLNY